MHDPGDYWRRRRAVIGVPCLKYGVSFRLDHLGTDADFANTRRLAIMGATQLDPKPPFVADSSFAVQIAFQRTYLLRVAMLQLRDAHLAEDIVQDTMVAALQGEAGFAGKSSLKTWLTGILKHKIVDAIRNKTRGPAFVSFDEECRIDDFDAMFDETGHWENPPADWGQPESQLSQKEFLETLHSCLEKLPPNTSRVFMMREVMELEADEICMELTITSTNLWVI